MLRALVHRLGRRTLEHPALPALARLRRRIARHGVGGTIALIPTNLLMIARRLSPARLRARAADRAFDREMRIDTAGTLPLGALDVAESASTREATYYQPVSSSIFHAAIGFLPERLEALSFVDYGSGKGRALILAGMLPFKSVIGVEFSPRLHQSAERNIALCQPRFRAGAVECLLLDAADFEPPPGPIVVFLANPFGPKLLRSVLERVLRDRARDIYVLYCYPFHRTVVDQMPFEEIGNGREFVAYRAGRQ